jgi:hypothetical protein
MPILKNKNKTLKGTLTQGRYREKLPLKKPVNFKKMKSPGELFKGKFSKSVVKYIYQLYIGKLNLTSRSGIKKYPFATKQELTKSFVSLKNKLKEKNIDIFNNSGQKLHFILPLSGMSPVGYFYKGIIEQLMPKARITFLKTIENRRNVPGYDLVNLKRSINKYDELFCVIDYFEKGSTLRLIENNLKEINPKFDLIGVNSPESRIDLESYNIINNNKNLLDIINSEYNKSNKFISKSTFREKMSPQKPLTRSFYKDIAQINTNRLIIPNYQAYKIEALEKGFFNEKVFNALKEMDQAQKYTYYYLGQKFISNVFKK